MMMSSHQGGPHLPVGSTPRSRYHHQPSYTYESSFTDNSLQVTGPFLAPPLPNFQGYMNPTAHLPRPMPPPTTIYTQPMASTPFPSFVPINGLNSSNGTAASHFGMGAQQPQIHDDSAPAAFDPDGMPPFEDVTSRFGPTGYGVVKIMNIPYPVTKAEIVHHLTRHCPLIETHVHGNPIHIIMERSTAKTMDCYVEVQNPYDAEAAAQRHENAVASGKHPKLGTRHIHIEVSSQDQLLKDLFPRAKNLAWENGNPIRTPNDDPYCSGFNGFFTVEEMVGLIRHAENPQRSPFSGKCLQRTFECMISTLYKLPWFATPLYTMFARKKLFDTYMAQLRVLVEKERERETVGLDHKLLMDFIFAGVNCPGFGERQKFQIACTSGQAGAGVNMSMLSAFWPFEVINKRLEGRNTTDDVVRFYLHLIELGVQVHLAAHRDTTASPFGFADYITYTLPSEYPPPDTMFINNTRFTATELGLQLFYETFLDMEISQMEMLLEAGWDKWQEEHGMRGLHICTKIEDVKQSYAATERNMQMIRHEGHERAEQAGQFDLERSSHGHTPMQSHTPASTSPPESPKGTKIPEADSISKTPVKPIIGYGSASAKQPAVSRIDPTSMPFRPRTFSDSIMVPHPDEGNLGRGLGFGVGGLGNGDFSGTSGKTQMQMFANTSIGQALQTSSSPFPTPLRRTGSNAVEIRNPDGTPLSFNLNTLSGRDERSQASSNRAASGTRADSPAMDQSPPKRPRSTTRRRSGSSPRSTSPSFNVAVGSPSMKTPNRKSISLHSTIHEEGESESERGDDGDDEDEVIMSAGRVKAGFT